MSAAVREITKFVGYRLPLPLRRRLLYARGQRRWGRLGRPVLFTEKVNWRILSDRRELLTWTCDKLRMKSYAREVAGDLVRVPADLWAGADVAGLAGVQLPERWVVKPNHLSGPVVFGAGLPDVARLREQTADWLRSGHADELGEWAYGTAQRTILAEQRIGSASPPTDLKFFVFDGRVECVQVDSERFTDHRRRFYDSQWGTLDVTNAYPSGPAHPRPSLLPELLAAATRLGTGFDFMRVDLYDVDGQVWFGELTPYPEGGLQPFRPRHFDRWLGQQWRLPEL